MLFLPANVCDDGNNMDCDNGWDESSCGYTEGDEFSLGIFLNFKLRFLVEA